MLGWGSFFFQKIGKRELMRITRKEEKEMMGAILGDIIGSPYEFDNGNKSKDFPLFCRQSTYTDDTVMSVAVCRAFLDVKRKVEGDFPSEVKSEGKLGISDNWILQNLADRMREFGRIFPYAGYGGMFFEWLRSPNLQAYNSYGNGSAMRVSSVARLYDDMESVPEAITAFLEGENFEDVIRTAISLGGDCDTLGAIAGSIAEAYYGVPDELKEECYNRLPQPLLEVLKEFEAYLGR